MATEPHSPECSRTQELHFLVVLHLVRVVLEWVDIRDGNGCNKVYDAFMMLLLSSEFCWICPSANQLQPLPSKTDKNFLEIFMNANLSSKNRSRTA